MIYVAGLPDSIVAPVKIGSSANAAMRLVGLQRGESMPLRVAQLIPDPSRLEILSTYPGTAVMERRLHGFFAERRVDGEWFDLGSVKVAVDLVEAAYQNAKQAEALATAVPGSVSATAQALAVTPEPLTQLAQDAARHHELFQAWLGAGFTEHQALQLLAHAIRSDLR